MKDIEAQNRSINEELSSLKAELEAERQKGNGTEEVRMKLEEANSEIERLMLCVDSIQEINLIKEMDNI